MKTIEDVCSRRRSARNWAWSQGGFTLVELLVAMAMSALVLAAIYRLSMDQQKVHIAQNQVVELQQNLRAALDMMEKDIRMAGYDPGKIAGAGCVVATAEQFQITADLSKDGDCSDNNENVAFFLATDDSGRKNLQRKSTAAGTGDTLIRDVERIEFSYTLADGTQTSTPGNPAQIRMVSIALLVRTSLQDANYIHDSQYITPSGSTWGPFRDHYRRRFLTNSVMCPNMGLL